MFEYANIYILIPKEYIAYTTLIECAFLSYRLWVFLIKISPEYGLRKKLVT